MRRFTTTDTAGLVEIADEKEVRVCGIVAALKEMITKKGDRMGFATIEDLVGSVEVVVFPETYAKAGHYLKTEEPLIVTGTVDVGEKSTKIKATDIVPLREISERETQRIHVNLQGTGLERRQLEELKGIFVRYRGSCQALLHINIQDTVNTTIRLPENCTLLASEELMVEVKNLLGYNAVSFE
jgi:DNA polymerase-3 subunit alpha